MTLYPNLTSVIEAGLRSQQKPPSGLLHCSSHSWKPIRFTQLEQVFEPEDKDFGDLMTLSTGTLFHTSVEKWLQDFLSDGWELSASELDLTDKLPQGWTGTLDWLFRHKASDTFVIGDLKTIKPEGIQYLTNEPKPEHRTQVSCYHAALVDDDHRLDPEIFVYYLPKGRDSRNQTVMPKTLTTKAMSKAAVWARLESIKSRVDEYVLEYQRTGEIDNDQLEPMPDPVLSMYWNNAGSVWDVKQGPHWYNAYSGLPDDLVPKQSTNKVGHWTIDGYYIPRKGWEHIEENMVPRPSVADFRSKQ